MSEQHRGPINHQTRLADWFGRRRNNRRFLSRPDGRCGKEAIKGTADRSRKMIQAGSLAS